MSVRYDRLVPALKAALAAVMIALYLSYLADILSGQLIDLQGWLQRLVPVLATH